MTLKTKAKCILSRNNGRHKILINKDCMIKTLYVTLYPQNIYNDISLYGKKNNMRGCCYNMHNCYPNFSSNI